jgi:hypothetical protein
MVERREKRLEVLAITWIRRILLPMECIGCPIDKGFAYI